MSEKCFICWGEYKKILSGKDYMHHSSSKIYNIVKCINCWVEMVNPLPTKKEIMSWYPSDYYSYHVMLNKKPLKEVLMNIVKNILASKKFDIPREEWNWKYFLDVWCGDGFNLKTMQKKWWESYGFEIGEKNKVWNIFYGPNISEIDFGTLKFDVIYLSHVMEHMEDPEWSFKKIYNLLKKWGKVILKTPNIDCISARYFWPYAVERDIPRHVVVHTKKSATLLFKKCWFTILKSKYLAQGTMYPWYLRRNEDQWKKSYWIMKIYFMLYRIYATIIWNTNQMWFILTK